MNKARHLSKAVHNEEFFNSLDIDTTKFRDWLVAGIFYAALHYYESYFAESEKHSSTHDIADDWINGDTQIADTYQDYRELKQYRWHASYRSRNFSPEEINKDVLPKLQNIKNRLQSLKLTTPPL